MADWLVTYAASESSDEQKSAFTDKLLKREEERQSEIQKRKEKDRDQSYNVQDSLQIFLDSFKSEKAEIESALDESSSMDRSKLIDHFDELSQRVSKLQRYLSESALFLPAYETKTAQNIIAVLQGKIQEKRNELLPKKKFAFKSKQKSDKKSATSSEIKQDESVKDSKAEDIVIELAACKFVGLSGASLEKKGNDVNQKDVALASLTDCNVRLFGAPSAIHMNKLKNCKVFCGPVPGSIFIRECVNCIFVLACQQLRIHSTTKSHFYIHVTSKAIIEDCTTVEFAPYNWTYKELNSDYETTGLAKDRNNWDKVDDFNWLAADVHSPNWSVIEESKRIKSWTE